MIRIEDIIEIRKAKIYDRGYEIVFPEDKIIWLTKRRTIAGLLLLIKYETCSEEDLVGANNRLREIGIGPNFGVGLLHECGST